MYIVKKDGLKIKSAVYLQLKEGHAYWRASIWRATKFTSREKARRLAQKFRATYTTAQH